VPSPIPLFKKNALNADQGSKKTKSSFRKIRWYRGGGKIVHILTPLKEEVRSPCRRQRGRGHLSSVRKGRIGKKISTNSPERGGGVLRAESGKNGKSTRQDRLTRKSHAGKAFH